MKFSAVILAGGRSSRMGRDKAWLMVEGQPLLARQIKLMRDCGADEVFISGRADTDYAALDCPVLHDKTPDSGPLGGIESALRQAGSPLLLVLAVDMPFMTAGMLGTLKARCTDARGVAPRVGDHHEPLAAFYPKTAQSIAEALIASGSKSATGFAEHCIKEKLVWLAELTAQDAMFFVSWNKPEDVLKGRQP